jgi:ABC-type nitrate/sulfonate/bicarbonate transport system substrate-binding protein
MKREANAVTMAAAWIVGLSIFASTGPAASQQLREVAVGLPSTSLGSATPRIAKEMGLFAKYGLDPKMTVMDNASVAIAALVSGSVKIVLAGPGELITARAAGRNVVTIANLYRGFAPTLVLSKTVADKLGVSPNAPIAERLKALNGLAIATPSATSNFTIGYKAAATKLAGSDIRFVFMAQTAMPIALETGAIQGYLASAPFWIFPVAKGTGVVWVSSPKGEIPSEFAPTSSSLVLTMRDYAEANPDIAKIFRDVVAEFGKAIDERPNDVKAAIAKVFPDLDAQTIETFYKAEASAWQTKPLTPSDIAREIEFTKGGTPLPNLDKLDPASMVVQ